MINKDTPYKLAEIIRDTWPQLYYSSEQLIMNHTTLLQEDKVLFTFPVLWREWECDGTAWIMERSDGTRYLKMTNHGGPYKADPLDLEERISYYEEVIKETKIALGMLNEKV